MKWLILFLLPATSCAVAERVALAGVRQMFREEIKNAVQPEFNELHRIVKDSIQKNEQTRGLALYHLREQNKSIRDLGARVTLIEGLVLKTDVKNQTKVRVYGRDG